MVVYKSQFEGLSNRLKGLCKRHKLSCFLSRLKDEIQLPVRMLNPINLKAAFGLEKSKQNIYWQPRYNGGMGKQILIKGLIQCGKGIDHKCQVFQFGWFHLLKWMKKIRKGLCYHCEEKWNLACVQGSKSLSLASGGLSSRNSGI